MRTLLLIGLMLFFFACQTSQESDPVTHANPPAEGFDLEGSDPKAIALADSVMLAMGGRANWDATRFISWNFFGRRSLLWDKHTGRVRIEIPGESSIYLTNINTDEGKVMVDGAEYSEPDSLKKYLGRAKNIWINDSYWLVMPFKLKDSGLTLSYLGQDTIRGGAKAEVLELIFKEVGRTPENKYRVYVNPQTHLVTQWDFYRKASDEKASLVTPWENYEQQGNILLSGGRGNREISDIAVFEKVPDSAFDSFSPLDKSLFE